MRKVIFLLIITLSLPTTLWASDPIVGTWKLNAEKSIFPPDTEYAMKEQTLPHLIISIRRFMTTAGKASARDINRT